MNTSHLPLPNIQDDQFQHLFEKNIICNTKTHPPKLKPRTNNFNSNIKNSGGANLISVAYSITYRSELNTSVSIVPMYHTLFIGNYFDHFFTNIEKIGEGSFGEVFKVQSKEDGQLYAVKISKQLFRSNKYRYERLEEVRRYEQFTGQHNCIRFYRAWEQDDRLFMQMELCRESLSQYLQRVRKIPESMVWSIVLDLLLALKGLHDQNLIHLDVKLDNILISYDNCCKLADFGLVVDVDMANRLQPAEGDSRYIAPEILQGKFSKAADIFSLGIAVFELSSNLKLPSYGPLWQQLRNGTLPENFIESLSPAVVALIKQMMNPEYRRRPSVDELLDHKIFHTSLRRRNNLLLNITLNWQLFRPKLCVIKHIIFNFLISLLSKLRIKKQLLNCTFNSSWISISNVCVTPDKETESTHSNIVQSLCSMLDVNSTWFGKTKYGTPKHAINGRIYNSTPVNCHKQSYRSRKNLTKTSFRNIAPITFSHCPQALFETNEIKFQSQLPVYEAKKSSSLKAKKLFSSNENIN